MWPRRSSTLLRVSQALQEREPHVLSLVLEEVVQVDRERGGKQQESEVLGPL